MENKKIQSAELIEQFRLMHEGNKHFKGVGCFNYHQQIRALVQKHDAHTLLDYGCGKGRQFTMQPGALYAKLGVYAENWQEALGVESIIGYDPASKMYSARPVGHFDGVYCCSVLEHIYEHDIDETLQDIFQYASKFIFLAVGTTPAKKNLPDGRNAHLTIRPMAWWLKKIGSVADAFPGIEWMIVEEEEKNPGSLKQYMRQGHSL